jgi:hypothetical protein
MPLAATSRRRYRAIEVTMDIQIQRESPDGLMTETWTFSYFGSDCPAARAHTLKVTEWKRETRKSLRAKLRYEDGWSTHNHFHDESPALPKDVLAEARRRFCDTLTVEGPGPSEDRRRR